MATPLSVLVISHSLDCHASGAGVLPPPSLDQLSYNLGLLFPGALWLPAFMLDARGLTYSPTRSQDIGVRQRCTEMAPKNNREGHHQHQGCSAAAKRSDPIVPVSCPPAAFEREVLRSGFMHSPFLGCSGWFSKKSTTSSSTYRAACEGSPSGTYWELSSK